MPFTVLSVHVFAYICASVCICVWACFGLCVCVCMSMSDSVCACIPASSYMTTSRPLLTYTSCGRGLCYGRQANVVVKALYEQHDDNAHLCTFLGVFIATFPFTETSSTGLATEMLLLKQLFLSQSCFILILSWLCFRNGYSCLYRC